MKEEGKRTSKGKAKEKEGKQKKQGKGKEQVKKRNRKINNRKAQT